MTLGYCRHVQPVQTVWSCFTPRSDLRQRRDKAWHSALWLSLGLSCHVICDWRGTPSKIPKQEKFLQIICFFHRFHFEFLFFIWCRKTGRFDGWNHKCIMKLQTLDKIFVVTSSFLLVMLFYNFQANAMQPHKDLAWQWFIRCDINKVMDIYLTLMCV